MTHRASRFPQFGLFHLSILVLGTALAAACNMNETSSPDAEQGDGDFISHRPGSTDVDAGTGGTTGAPNGSGGKAAGDGSGDPGRAIAEADIVHVDGDRLFALSRYSGLTVVDVSNPARLATLGTHRTSATPFEMYLEGSVAYVMFTGWTTSAAGDGGISWQTTSRLQALDVSEPSHIEVLGDFEISGAISDSRKVGDVLYLVTQEDGYCWGCESEPNTRVVSFDISSADELVKIDELRYSNASHSWGARSVTVTPERMYVSGFEYDESTAEASTSTIQVVDISDPGGALVEGAKVPVAGQVQSRWQMDEHDGTLRVITQPGLWGSTLPPVVETFEVASASDVTPLASLEFVLPRPEALQSVRFDGTRAYAITFERTDPLFTFDLSDPSAPRQLGELEIPGWVHHMEPRGDRLYAVGFDQAAEAGSLHVSLFDVSNLSQPTLLERVNFGGEWASFAEDQDRIHKSFRLFEEAGLIVVPFSGYTSEVECTPRWFSGVQLVDFTRDTLALRGAAPLVGAARRALLHDDALIGVSDNVVEVFDISDRDAPEALGRADLARHITSIHPVGDRLLRFGSDWYSNEALLDVVEAENAESFESLSRLDVSEVVPAPESCSKYSEAYFGDVLYREGTHAYVARRGYAYDEAEDKHVSTLGFVIVDTTDAESIRAVGYVELDPATAGESFGEIVKTESALLVGRTTYAYDNETGESTQSYSYDVLDLTDPKRPRVVERFEMPARLVSGGWGRGYAGCSVDMGYGWMNWGYGTAALVSGDIVVSQHEEPLKDGSGRVRYYLDRLDVSDPSRPRLLDRVNVPGAVVQYDHETERAVTLEYTLDVTAGEGADACYDNANSYFDEDKDECRVYRRRVNSLSVAGGVARRLDVEELEKGERAVREIAISDERVFFRYFEKDSNVGQLGVLALSDDGEFGRKGSVPISGYWGSLVARGSRAFFSSENQLQVVSGSKPSVRSYPMPGWHCSALQVADDVAYCALGRNGVARFELD